MQLHGHNMYKNKMKLTLFLNKVIRCWHFYKITHFMTKLSTVTTAICLSDVYPSVSFICIFPWWRGLPITSFERKFIN